MSKALAWVLSHSWAITPEWLQTIAEIADRDGPGPDAVAAQLGRPLDNTQAITVRDGVAIIPVSGPIFRYANLFTAISGGASVEILARDFTTALNDPMVKAILLTVDSPGGEVSGINEFSQMVFEARGQKPIVSYIGAMGASAAYWIASAADEVVADSTAIIGSIGVVQTLPNPAGRSIRDIEIVSSTSPNKRPDVSTERGRAQIQKTIDDLAEVFVRTVARNRGVSVETVLSDFGQGGVLVGQAAVEVKMVDRLGSFEGTLATLAERGRRAPAVFSLGRPLGAVQEMNRMDWKAFWGGLIGAAEEAKPDTAPEAQPATQPASEPVVGTVAVSVTAELEQLRAAAKELEQFKAQQQQTIAASRASAAKTWTEAQIREGRALPADADALSAVYAACYDAECVDQLRTLFAARPAHSILEEQLPAGSDVGVLNAAASPEQEELVKQARAQIDAHVKQSKPRA